MIPLTKDLILLCSVTPVYEYTDWAQDAWGYEESTAINSLLNELSGPYFLRTSDGALFKSPFDIDDHHGDGNMMDIGRLLKFTPDKKQMVICPSDIIQKQSEIWLKPSGDVPNDFIPWVITDKGGSFELKMPSESLLDKGSIGGFIISKNNRILPLNYRGNGTWSFDMELNPLFVDYTPKLQSVLSFKGPELYYLFDFESDSYIFGRDYETGLFVYRIFENGNKLDCALVCSQPCDVNDTFINFDYSSHSVAYNANGALFMFNGCKVSVDIRNASIFREDFPEGFPKSIRAYDQNGIAYVFAENEIRKYNLNTKQITNIPIHWEQVDFGGFVTYTTYFSNGIFSVSGKTRTAQSVTVLIDAETGNVSLTDLSEYAGPVVKSYYRLN